MKMTLSNHSWVALVVGTISEATQQQVDAEVRRIIDEQYHVARNILENNKDIAHAMVKALDGMGND